MTYSRNTPKKHPKRPYTPEFEAHFWETVAQRPDETDNDWKVRTGNAIQSFQAAKLEYLEAKKRVTEYKRDLKARTKEADRYDTLDRRAEFEAKAKQADVDGFYDNERRRLLAAHEVRNGGDPSLMDEWNFPLEFERKRIAEKIAEVEATLDMDLLERLAVERAKRVGVID